MEHSPWLSTWYEDGSFIKIPIEEFDTRTISFTYGDSMPTFSPKVNDGREYRKKCYTYEEILKIIEKCGLPQDWNRDGGMGRSGILKLMFGVMKQFAGVVSEIFYMNVHSPYYYFNVADPDGNVLEVMGNYV